VLAGHREDAVLDFEPDLVGPKPGKVGTDDERGVPADHVD